MKLLWALTLATAVWLALPAEHASAARLTVCNMTDSARSGVFFNPVVSGFGHTVTIAPRSCVDLQGVPDGEYKISLYNGSDCFRPVSIYGDTTYTLEQAAQDQCDKDEMDSLDY